MAIQSCSDYVLSAFYVPCLLLGDLMMGKTDVGLDPKDSGFLKSKKLLFL